MRALTTLLLLAATVALSGCAVRDAGQIALATASAPACSAQLVAHLGESLADVSDEFIRIDTTLGQVTGVIAGRADLTLVDAVLEVAGAPARVVELESDYQALYDAVVATPGETPSGLVLCHETISAGWDAATGNDSVVSALDVIRVWGPTAAGALCVANPATCPAAAAIGGFAK